MQELNVAHTALHKPQAGNSKCTLLPLWLTAVGHGRGGIFHPCITPPPLSQSCGHIQNLLQTSGFPSSLSDKSCYLHFPHTPAPGSPHVFPDTAFLSMPRGSHLLPPVPAFPPIVLGSPVPHHQVPSWGCCRTCRPLSGCVLLRNSC